MRWRCVADRCNVGIEHEGTERFVESSEGDTSTVLKEKGCFVLSSQSPMMYARFIMFLSIPHCHLGVSCSLVRVRDVKLIYYRRLLFLFKSLIRTKTNTDRQRELSKLKHTEIDQLNGYPSN